MSNIKCSVLLYHSHFPHNVFPLPWPARSFDRLALIGFDLFGAFALSIFNLSLSLVLHPFGSPLPISIVFQRHFSCYADSIFEKKDGKCLLFLHLPLPMPPSRSVVCIVFAVSAALEFCSGRGRRSVGSRRKVQFSGWSYLVWTVGSHLIGLINQIFPTKWRSFSQRPRRCASCGFQIVMMT